MPQPPDPTLSSSVLPRPSVLEGLSEPIHDVFPLLLRGCSCPGSGEGMVEEGSSVERLGQFSVEECGVQTNMTILVQNHDTLPVLVFFFSSLKVLAKCSYFSPG